MKFKFGQKVKLMTPFYDNMEGVIVESQTFADKTIYTIRIEIHTYVLDHSYIDVKLSSKFVKLVK